MSVAAEEKDGMDRLFDSLEATNASIKMIGADVSVTNEAVRAIGDRMNGFENRLGALERADVRTVEFKKSASEADAKLFSDQAALVIAIEETRTASKEALEVSKEALVVAKASSAQVTEAFEESKKAYNAARLAFDASRAGLSVMKDVKTSTDATTTEVSLVKTGVTEIKIEEQKKPKVPVALAATLNLLLGLVYVILELLRRSGH